MRIASIIHRDVKPHVLFTDDGRAKLPDFGTLPRREAD